MSAYQIYLDAELEQAVLLGALSSAEAWLVQDQILLQQSEFLYLPKSWQGIWDRLKFSSHERAPGESLQ
jgi:hypothetical protein